MSSRDGCFYLQTSVHQQLIAVSALRYFIGAAAARQEGGWTAASARGQAGGHSTPPLFP